MNLTDIINPRENVINIRSTDSEKREITGIGVPYGQTISTFDWETWENVDERFAPGSVELDETAILRYGHAEPIGKIISGHDTEDGFEITAVISRTARGDEVWQLIKDGVLTRMSIGFIGLEKTINTIGERAELTWTKALAKEFSVVEFPAYSEAKITGTRSETPNPDKEEKENNMNTEELVERIEHLERAQASQQHTQPDTTPVFRSYGEYARAYMRGDSQAIAFREAVQGTDTAVQRNPWLGVLVEQMQAKQRVISMFTRRALAPEGMHVDYVKVKTKAAINVGKQANEGDALATGTIATYEGAAAPVVTYGGTVDNVSRQLLERVSDINVAEDIFTHLAFQYGAEVEKAFKKLFTDTHTKNLTTPTVTVSKAFDELKVADFFDIFEDLADAYEDTAYVMDGVAVSTDVFRYLRNLTEANTAFQAGGAPLSKVGTYQGPAQNTLVLHDGTLIRRVPQWSGNQMTGFNAGALVLLEESGTPTRLQDEHNKTLTKDFGVYGYAAMFAPRAELLTAVKFGG